jgi:succinoglycan biosynthesis protein ExoW
MSAIQQTFAVIIPFYQRNPGLLLAAVRSALAQQSVETKVIVVDDSSPQPAEAELAALCEPDRARVTIIRQPNAGPGAARNRGLDAVAAWVELVAFLDSDDQWTPDHLANAQAAFAVGADVYFCDYVPLGSDASTFLQCGLGPDTGEPLGTGNDLYQYVPDLFGALLRRSPVGTSTVVFRRSIAPDLRFRTDFSYAEDVFFWMHLARRARMIAFSTRCEAVYGAGVNIAAGAAWGSPQHLRRTWWDYAFHQAVIKDFPLTAEQARWNDAWMDELARTFAASFLHLLRRRGEIDWSIVRRFVAARPWLPLQAALLPVTSRSRS